MMKEKSVEWYTPSWVFEMLGIGFDLDPASPIDFETAVPATQKLTVLEDGLQANWSGRVWLNPPFSKETGLWMRKMADHGNGIALSFSRTDARWFQDCMKSSGAVLFLSGRINFVPGHENAVKRSRAGAGTALFAWGDECVAALSRLRSKGVLFVPHSTVESAVN